jgi:peptide/nickel transport system permease protein
MTCWREILTRLLMAAVTVIVGVFFSAVLVRYAPGFGTDERQLDARLSGESIEAIRREMAGEQNVAAYFVDAVQKLKQGDLGTSRAFHRPVRDLLTERGWVTIHLLGAGLGVAWAAAILVVMASWLSGSAALARTSSLGSGMLLCLPAGAIALLLIVADGPACLALALVVYPKIYRYLTNLVVSAGRTPHVLAARAKGISNARLLAWHVVPAIRREVVALTGVSLGMALSAAIPVEAFCGIPGIGQLAWQAALARDVPVLTMVSLVVIASTVLANSGADLLADQSRHAT